MKSPLHGVAEAFRPGSDGDTLALIEAYPLAWLVAEGLTPVLLPVRPRRTDERLAGFQGHIPRGLAGPLHDGLEGVLLFTGPTGYVSPSWFENRKQAPTWASASAAFRCRLTRSDKPDDIRLILEDLVDALEKGRENEWRIEELSDRYDGLSSRIVGFQAEILDSRAAFRLCQNEDEDTFGRIVDGLSGANQSALATMMKRFR